MKLPTPIRRRGLHLEGNFEPVGKSGEDQNWRQKKSIKIILFVCGCASRCNKECTLDRRERVLIQMLCCTGNKENERR